MNAKWVLAFGAWTVGLLGGAFAVLGPHLTARQEVALIAGLAVAVGLPAVALWVHWWVNESVFGSDGRRPRQA